MRAQSADSISPTGQMFTLRAPFFTEVTEVWPRANWAVVTNNLSTIIEVVQIDVALVEGFHMAFFWRMKISEV